MNLARTRKDLLKEIEGFAKEIKLPAMKSCFEKDAREAAISDLSYEEYLHGILQKECDMRHENARQNRIRYAGFPYKKYIENLETAALPSDAQKKLKIYT